MCLYGSPSKTFAGLITRGLGPIKSSIALISTDKVSVPNVRQTKITQQDVQGSCCCDRTKDIKCIRSFSDRSAPPQNVYQAYWDEKAESKKKNSKNPSKWASTKRFDDIYRADDVDKPKRVCVRTWTEFREPIKHRQDVRSLKGGIASEMALRPQKVRYFTLIPAEPTEMDLE